MSSDAWVGEIDGERWVVRVPVGDGRRPTPDYRAESVLLGAAAERGVPVAASTVVEVDGIACSVARERPGRPVGPDDWNESLVTDLASALAGLHGLPPSLAVEQDIVARFHLATIWPFDGSDLGSHSVAFRWPGSFHRYANGARSAQPEPGQRPSCTGPARRAPSGRRWTPHRLARPGRHVPGPAEWDIACLRYYHRGIADQVLAVGDRWDPARARLLVIPFVLYKLAKQPERRS